MQPDQVVPFLSWMVVVVGAALLGVLLWIFLRVQKHIDDLPKTIADKVGVVHSELIAQMARMNETHAKLEEDLRDQFTKLDRRVTILEVLNEVEGGRRK